MDGDGLTNEFENKYNLDPYNEDSDADGILDGDEDEDKDGLTNLEEQNRGYNNCLDPWKKDTDGDGFNDKTELDKGTDPCDANSKPKSLWWLFWLLLLLLIIVALVGYFEYPKYKEYIEKKKSKKITRRPLPPPITKRKPVMMARPRPNNKLQTLLEKKKKEKVQKRKGLFSAFGGKEGPEQKKKEELKGDEKEEKKEVKRPWVDVSDLKKKPETKTSKQDTFKKLEQISRGQKKLRKDVFKKLEQVSKKPKVIPVIVKKSVPKSQIPVCSTKTSKVYHKKECITLKGKKNILNYKNIQEAKRKGLKPCKVCLPVKQRKS